MEGGVTLDLTDPAPFERGITAGIVGSGHVCEKVRGDFGAPVV